jgi:hypothetical protein
VRSPGQLGIPISFLIQFVCQDDDAFTFSRFFASLPFISVECRRRAQQQQHFFSSAAQTRDDALA